MPERPLIGVSITDAQLRARLCEYASRCGVRTSVVRPDDARIRECRGLIWDLAPVNETVAERLRALRDHYPVTPVLLYVRPDPGTGPFIQQCVAIPLTRLQFQAPIIEESTQIVRGIGWVLDADLKGRLTRLADALWPSLPPTAARFVAAAIQRIAAEHGASEPSAARLTTALSVSERSLELWCEKGDLPPPKRTTAWLSALYVGLAAEALKRPLDNAVSDLGFDHRQFFDRLHALAPELSITATDASQQLGRLIQALVEECRLPAERLAAARASVA